VTAIARKTGFQHRVVAAILAIGIVSVALGLTAVFFFGRASLEQAIGATYEELAQITAENLDEEIRHHLHEARTLAQASDVGRVVTESNLTYQGSTRQEIARQLATIEDRWAHDEGVDAYLHALLTNDATAYLKAFEQGDDPEPTHLQILVADAHGAVVAATRRPKHYDFSEQAWWKHVMATGSPYVGDVVRSEDDDAYIFALAQPVRWGSDQVIGVLYMVHDAPRFFTRVTGVSVAQAEHTMLVNSDGLIIFCPILPIKTHHLSPALRSMVLRDHAGWVGSAEDVHYPGRLAINGFAPVPMTFDADRGDFGGKRWHIVTSQDPKEAFAPIYDLLKWVALTGLLGSLVIAGVGFVAARRIIRPIHVLREGVERISAGNLEHTIHVKSDDEIEELAAAFNQMTEKLRASYSGLEAKIAERTRELETKNRELFALYAIVSTLNRLGHTEEGFRDALNKVMVTLRTDAISLRIFGDGGAVTAYTVPHNALDGEGPAHAMEQIEGRIRSDPHPLYVDDLRTNTQLNLLERELGYLGLACCPLLAKDDLVGVLHLLDRDPRVYTATERALVDAIAGQLAMSVENLRLSREET
jgi:two-component system NtrC family sensor kinase